MKHTCFRCRRTGTRGFIVEDTVVMGEGVARCAARRACDARKLRYLKATYPFWGK